MKTMKLYHISDTPVVTNTIMLSMDREVLVGDIIIPLESPHLCPSVYGCLCANKFPDSYPANTDFKKGITFSIFMADIPIEEISDMDETKYPDAWFTREKTISGSHKFTKIGELILRVQEYIDDVYCKFTMCGVDMKPVPYIKNGPVVYGSKFNFSFIGYNPNSKLNEKLVPGIIDDHTLDYADPNLKKEN